MAFFAKLIDDDEQKFDVCMKHQLFDTAIDVSGLFFCLAVPAAIPFLLPPLQVSRPSALRFRSLCVDPHCAGCNRAQGSGSSDGGGRQGAGQAEGNVRRPEIARPNCDGAGEPQGEVEE